MAYWMIADYQPLVRDAFKKIIRTVVPEVDGIAENPSGAEAWPRVDFAILASTELKERDSVRRLRHRWPDVRILMMLEPTPAERFWEAIQAGADICLPRTAEVTEIEGAVLALAHGRRFITQTVAEHILEGDRSRFLRYAALLTIQRRLLRKIAGGVDQRSAAAELCLSENELDEVLFNAWRTVATWVRDPLSPDFLSPRQREFLILKRNGLTDNEVAQMACVSIKTVESALDQARVRLGCNSTQAAVHRAEELGLLDD